MDLKNYNPIKQTKITNERQLILQQFLETLNSERDPKKFKPLKPARIGMMMRFMTVSQMKTFYGECKYANSFSKYFWWSFKAK